MDKIERYAVALEKLKGKDRGGVGGEIAATGAATLAGAGLSGTIASAFGATTLLGSSTLGSSVLGTIFVTTTPVGWIIGSAVAAGAIGYGVSKACRSGGKNDQIRKHYRRELEKLIAKEKQAENRQHRYDKLIDKLQQGVLAGDLTPEESDEYIRQVEGLNAAWQTQRDA